MSIANKLIYLNGTKEKLKDSINNIGGSITDETTFRAYATELDNIYTNLPKTTGEGSNLSLTTLKGRINVDDILGDTQQDTYEGYNLLPITTTDGTYYGVTFKNNDDGSITLNGTPTTSNAINIYEGEISLSGDYVFYLYGNDSSISCSVLIDNTTTTLFGFSSSSSTTAKNYTSSTMTKLYLWVTPDHPYTNKVIKPMLVKGTDTTKPFQKYVGGQASPNPTYPQDINVVTGTQEVVVQNENIFNGEMELGTIANTTGENAVNNSTIRSIGYININNCRKFGIASSDNSTQTKGLRFYDKNKHYLGRASIIGNLQINVDTLPNIQDATNYYTSNSDIYYMRFVITTSNDLSIKYGVMNNSTTYIEHQEQTKTLHLSSKNLLEGLEFGDINAQTGVEGTSTTVLRSTNYIPYDTSKTYYVSVNNVRSAKILNLRFYNKSKQYIGYSTLQESGSNFNVTTGSGVTTTDLIPKYFRIRSDISLGAFSSLTDENMISNYSSLTYEPYYYYELAKIGTYQDRIFESSGKNLFDKDTTKEGYLIQVNGEEVANASYGASDYIPIKANTYYTRTNCNNYYGAFYNTNKEFVGAITNANTILSSVDGYVRISFLLTNVEKVMLNEGSTALPYEPYGSDKWYIEKKIGKYNVTGNETWKYSVSNVVFYADMLQDLAVVGTSILCNYFTPVANTTQYADMTNGQCKAENNTLKRFACKNTTYSDATNFQNWLKSINMNIYYQMATPTYTEITNETLLNELNELEKMMSYNGQTNISVSGNLPMILDITALKGE